MKRAWNENDFITATELKEAMRVAESLDFTNDDNDFVLENITDATTTKEEEEKKKVKVDKGEGDNDFVFEVNDDPETKDETGGKNKEEEEEEEETDEEGEGDDQEELDVEYVKEHFDDLYVQKVVKWMEEGLNTFITGSQGRGKSTCVLGVIRHLYEKGVRLMVTGSTGPAAFNLGDATLEELFKAVDNDRLSPEMADILAPATTHSAFGLRRREIDCIDECRANADSVKTFMGKYRRWHQRDRDFFLRRKRSVSCMRIPAIAYAEVVIIDEVSMHDGLMVEVLDEVGKFWWPKPKQAGRPFGGIIMIFAGDFQQLPPVGSGTRQNPVYLFEHPKWTTTTSRDGWVDRVLPLEVNLRQEGDLEYGRLLDRMAMNRLTSEDEDLLSRCVLRPVNGSNGLIAALNPCVMPGIVRVFNSQDRISKYTKAVMDEVDARYKVTLTVCEEYDPNVEDIYSAYGRGKVQDKVKAFIAKTAANADKEFYIGCPVRILENKDVGEGIVNGAIGRLKGLTERGGHPIIELKSGKQCTLQRSNHSIYLDDYTTRQRRDIEQGRSRQQFGKPVAKFTYRHYPLKMALAMTPHALQGCTVDTAIIHPNIDYENEYTTIECLYVALSRLRSSGLENPHKSETLRAIPRPTIHPKDFNDDDGDDDTPQPLGLYLTRRALYPYFVRPKVRNYIDHIQEYHSPFGRRQQQQQQ